MRVYEAIFENEETQGMYRLSVVSDPAMEDQWIMLAKHPEEIQFSAVDEEKRLLLGAVLIPNKRIRRNINGNEFEMFFSAETIEKIGHDFIRKGNQNNSSLNHKEPLEGMSVVESWTVQDPLRDKSTTYGKSYDKGTLVQMMKVDNDEVWAKAKKGEITGFSLDAVLRLQEIKLNKDMSTETKSITDAINKGFEDIKVFLNIHKDPKTDELPKEIEAIKVELDKKSTELKTQFEQKFTDKDEELDKIKIELSDKVKEIEKLGDLAKDIIAKDKEIADLKVELGKKPEVDPIKAKPAPEVKKVFKIAPNARMTTEQRVNQALWGQ